MKLSDFPLLTDARTQEKLHAFVRSLNDNRTDYPRDKTVHARFVEQAAKAPDAAAVLDGDRLYTYREVDHMSNRVARLLADKGVPPGALVGVLLDRPFEM